MRRVLGVFIAAVLTAAIVCVPVALSITGPAVGAGNFRISGCAVRFDPVRIIDNSSHACMGIDAVGTDSSGNVKLVKAATGGSIMSVTIEEDESMTELGIQAGGSGGGAETVVWMYRNGTRVTAGSQLLADCDYCNLWVTLIEYVPVMGLGR